MGQKDARMIGFGLDSVEPRSAIVRTISFEHSPRYVTWLNHPNGEIKIDPLAVLTSIYHDDELSLLIATVTSLDEGVQFQRGVLPQNLASAVRELTALGVGGYYSVGTRFDRNCTGGTPSALREMEDRGIPLIYIEPAKYPSTSHGGIIKVEGMDAYRIADTLHGLTDLLVQERPRSE